MTDFIPLIVQDNGDGTGQARRIAENEAVELARNILKWLPDNSVVMKGGNGVVGAIRIFPGQMLGRSGDSGIDSLDSSEVMDNLGLPALLAGKANAAHQHAFIQAISDIDWTTLGDGRVLGREGGEFVWVEKSTGGTGSTGGLSNSLDNDLDLNGNGLVDGDTELIRVQDGKVYLFNKEVFEFDVTEAEEGFIPRFNEDEGKYEGGLPQVGDLVGGTAGKFLAVGENLRVEEVDAPGGGGTSTGGPPSTSGASYPSSFSANSSFTRTDLIRGYVYRDDLPLKYADSDAATLQGWVGTSERAITVRRADLDLNANPGYILGDGYNAGVYFPEAAVIRRMNMTVGANTAGDVQYRVHEHPGNAEGVNVRTAAIAGPAAFDEPWIVIPAGSILSLYGENWTFKTRETYIELIVSDFSLDTTGPQTV